MRAWNLLELEAPDGIRDPVVVHSTDEARAVLLVLKPGQRLGEHEVKEHAYVVVVSGNVQVSVGGESSEGGPGMMFRFEPSERHSLSSEEGARVLLLLAPWPGPGHYRGGGPTAA